MLLAASYWGQALGVWKMVPSKSRLGRSDPVTAITAQYEARSEAEVWTFHQVRTDGALETTSQTLHFDGKEYPCGDLSLEERPDTVVSRRLDARTVEVSYRKSGRLARRVVRTVSADGKQMTLEVRITPEKGPAEDRLVVFAR
jgi:hypothetical protein